MLLLKKIEELTLYIIEMDKTNQKHTLRLTEQDAVIQDLKMKIDKK